MTTETAGLYEKIIEETDVNSLFKEEEIRKDLIPRDESMQVLAAANSNQSLESLISPTPIFQNYFNVNDLVLNKSWLASQISKLLTYMNEQYSFVRVYGFLSGLNQFIKEHKESLEIKQDYHNIISKNIDYLSSQYLSSMESGHPNRLFDIGDVVRIIPFPINSYYLNEYIQNRKRLFSIGSIGSVIKIGDIETSNATFTSGIAVKFSENNAYEWPKKNGKDSIPDYAEEFNKGEKRLVGIYIKEELAYVPINRLHGSEFMIEIAKLEKMIEK